MGALLHLSGFLPTSGCASSSAVRTSASDGDARVGQEARPPSSSPDASWPSRFVGRSGLPAEAACLSPVGREPIGRRIDPGEWIGRLVRVEIDRPTGTAHPRFEGLVYPVNHGFVPGTLAADGHPVDAHVLGMEKRLERFEGRSIAIVRREDDAEDKLVVADEGVDLTDGEILRSVSFQERFFGSVALRRRR